MTIGTLIMDYLGWVFEFASSLAPFLATGGAFVVLLRVFQRKWRWAALWSLTAGCFGLLWFAAVGDALPLRPDGGRTITVLTANVYAANEEYDAVYEWARQSDADILVFQEVTGAWGRALDPLNQTYLSQTVGLGIRAYARHPISNRQTIPLVQGGLDAVQFEVNVPGGPITVVAVHLVSPVTATDLAVRNRQLDALARHVRTIEGDTVLVGDLNTAATTLKFMELMDISRLNRPQAPLFFGTWPQIVPGGLFQIDHVLVSEGLGYASINTLETPGSDHYALEVEIVRVP